MESGKLDFLVRLMYFLVLLLCVVLFVYSAGYARDVNGLERSCNEYWLAELERLCPVGVPGEVAAWNVTLVGGRGG